MLSCASNVIPSKGRHWRLFFEDPKFVASPSPPQSLLMYAEIVVFDIAAQSSPSSTYSIYKRYDRRVLEFIDLELES